MPNKTESYDRQSDVKLKKTADSMGYRGLVRQLSPVTIVLAASVLTFLLLMGLGWQVWKSYQDHKWSQEQAFPIQALRDKIIHFDEVLTMSANMAAATGDKQWEKRYRQFEPKLDAAIKSLEKLAGETFDSKSAVQTDKANVKLVEMENQVFKLVGQGRLDQAQAIISGNDYRRQKELYSDGMQRIASDLENLISSNLESHRKKALISVVSLLVSLPLLALLWLLVLQNMRRHLKERLLAEEALKESEKKYRGFLEASPDATAVFNENGRIVMVNSMMEKMFGYSRQALLAMTAEELMAERFRDIHVDHCANYLADPAIKLMGSGHGAFGLRKDGTEFPADISLGPLETEEGLIVVASIRDITERKRSEEALEKSEQQFRSVVETATSAIISSDKNGNIVFWNHKAEKLFGYSVEEILNQSLTKIMPHRYHETHLKGYKHLIETGKSRIRDGAVELFGLKKDGNEFPLELFLSKWKVEEDIFFTAIINDITDRKRAEEALRESEDRFRDFFANAPIGFHIFDSNQIITSVNDSELEMIGYSRDEIVGKKAWADLIVPEQKERFEKHWHEIATTGKVTNLEYKLVHKQGHHIDVILNTSSRFDADGKLVNTRGSILNITDRKQAEKQRNKLVKALEYKNTELQDIVYTASHDLRSPLVNIEGFSGELGTECDRLMELLVEQSEGGDTIDQIESVLKEDIPECLRFINSGAKKMSSLLDGLLQISRIGTVKIHSESLDMQKTVREILDAMSHQIKENNITVTVEMVPDCIGDSHMLDHVFTNLISNAIKYRDRAKESEIKISGRVEDSMSIYCVEDNGIGIAPMHQEKVFEIFHRLNPDDPVKGEGLGLTIVKRVLDRLGGKIRLESEQGKGSKFFFAIPTVYSHN
ncbi:MAG: PAS domain S-box protein [Planctomycetes bacterium]|nr:PAS domain S-box protein [Planctomycetota bacterium]